MKNIFIILIYFGIWIPGWGICLETDLQLLKAEQKFIQCVTPLKEWFKSSGLKQNEFYISQLRKDFEKSTSNKENFYQIGIWEFNAKAGSLSTLLGTFGDIKFVFEFGLNDEAKIKHVLYSRK